ncbi:MAG: hypothetical protein KDK97_10070 [Verrucomicrobiales bacterium]|nr:hypothetical protein [Verrucomicrobiales bacterium]MCP5556871.1 hypothetical protein [Verrucomicrobiaceae bacterium]
MMTDSTAMQTRPLPAKNSRPYSVSRISVLGLLALAGMSFSLAAQEAAEKDPGARMEAIKKQIKEVAPGKYDLDGIIIDAATREVRVPTEVNLVKAPVEYMLVQDKGKTHESVLKTTLDPLVIQVALLLANYEPGTENLFAKAPAGAELPNFPQLKPTKPGAHLVNIEVEWEAEGKKKRSPLSQWVQNIDVYKPAPDMDVWMFTGSKIDERGFVASVDGSIIAVWADPSALLNSMAKGNERDELWISLPANIPPEGTPVTLIITPNPQPQKP